MFAERGAWWRAWALLWPSWIILGALFLVPLAMLFFVSLHQADDLGNAQPIADWRAYLHSGQVLSNYSDSMEPLFLRIHLRSFWLAVVTTVLCLAIGYPVAYFIALVAPPRRKNLLLALAVVPFWTSFLIRIAAWRLILADQGLLNSLLINLHLVHEPLRLLDTTLAVMIGLVYGELPFMILPLYASLEKLDRSLLEASADLGAPPAATFFRVTVPMTLPGIIAGIVLVFIPGIGQFIVSDMLGGARTMLIGNMIQDQFTSGRNKPLGAALAFELTAMVLALLVAYALYARGRTASEGLV
ncbi:MAG: ABC transporter permease [Planctomycetota bacterium]|nr:ABC transporter permease [Planctomycetota bacterium]